MSDTPHKAPVNAATGEPRRPATIWTATVCEALAIVCFGVSLATVFWNAVDHFAEASWLMAQFDTDPGSLPRVLLSVAVTAAALIPVIACVIAGFYAWAGYRWTRWAGIIAAGLTGLGWLLNVIAWPAAVLAVAAAVLIWLPPSARFFAAWNSRRHPAPHDAPPVTDVWYGPSPRYL